MGSGRGVGAAVQQQRQLRPGLLRKPARQEVAAADIGVVRQETQRVLHSRHVCILQMHADGQALSGLCVRAENCMIRPVFLVIQL